ncbi:MAG: DUF4170 domain-containing protein [Kiloniellales bacterium]
MTAERQQRERRGTAQFWVVGGNYTDTHFQEALAPGEQWFGPFDDYESAKEEWAKHAWRTVDDCTTRYRIERIDPESPPPCTD